MIFDMGRNQFNSCAFFAMFFMVVGGASTAALADATTQPSAQGASSQVLDPAIAAGVRDAVAAQSYQHSDIKGGAFTKYPFEDVSPDGVLIGFRIGLGYFFNTEVIKFIQPIYLTPRGEEFGQGFGDENEVERRVEAKAPSGFAVGAVDIRGGAGLGAMTITFMRFNGTRIDPTDIMVTPKIGVGKDGGGLLDGDGTPIIGIFGRQDEKGQFLGLGLIFVKPTAMVERQ